MADDMRDREQTMQQDVLLVATAGFSLFNGQASSPIFDPVLFLLKPFIAQLVSSPILLFYMTSLFLSVMTLLVAGVPAAIYERIRGQTASSPVSIGIWFAVTLLLTLPTLRVMLGFAQ
jgi:hypothetical protein